MHSEFVCYRTCYVNGESGQCIANEIRRRRITRSVDNAMITFMKISSPNYRSELPFAPFVRIGNYRGSTVCRYVYSLITGNKIMLITHVQVSYQV